MTEKAAHCIVLIDDERVAMRTYQQDLELEGYEVRHYSSTADVKTLLATEQHEQVDLFIIDIMMPPEPLYSGEKTEYGLVTGLFLAQDIRDVYPDTPIILLSNTSFEAVRMSAKRLTARLDNCILLRKYETLPLDLTETVNRYFKELKLTPAHKRNILS